MLQSGKKKPLVRQANGSLYNSLENYQWFGDTDSFRLSVRYELLSDKWCLDSPARCMKGRSSLFFESRASQCWLRSKLRPHQLRKHFRCWWKWHCWSRTLRVFLAGWVCFGLSPCSCFSTARLFCIAWRDEAPPLPSPFVYHSFLAGSCKFCPPSGKHPSRAENRAGCHSRACRFPHTPWWFCRCVFRRFSARCALVRAL